MTSQWMLYAAACAGVLGTGALATERVLQLFALPQRWVWLAAILGSLLVPFALPRLEAMSPLEPDAGEQALPLVAAPGRGAATVATSVPAVNPSLAADRLAVGGWLLASAGVGSWLFLSALSLRRARRRWVRRLVDGTPVLVSPGTGPAVVGWVRGEVVLPRWVLDGDESQRRLVVAHEREHLRAGDPLLLMAGWVSLALTPWCLPLWWQVRRLRLAVEVDCDRRVLRESGDVRAYGTLLLEVGRRTQRGWIPVAAFSEPRRTLERRLRMITWKRPPHRGWRAAGVLAASALVPAALFALPVVPGPSLTRIAELLPRPAAPQEAAVLWITAGGEYRIGAPDAPVVREDGLAEALSSLRRRAPEAGALIVRTDSARVDAPGMGYSAVMAGNIACAAGFSALSYELVTRAAGPGSMRVVAARTRPLTPPCAAPGGADTSRADGGTILPEADAAGALSEMASRLAFPGSGWLDTIPDDTVHQMAALERQPELVNAREIQELMNRGYPADLRGAGIGGRVLVEFQIRRDGVVDSATIAVVETSHERLAEATRSVVTRFLFRPAMYDGRPVRTVVRMPITWQPPAPPVVVPQGAAPARSPVPARGNAPAAVPFAYEPAAAGRPAAPSGTGQISGTIAGRVLDARGRPVAGASVVAPGLETGAVTNEEGRFALRVPSGEVEVHVLAPGAPRAVIRRVTVPGAADPVRLDVTVPER